MNKKSQPWDADWKVIKHIGGGGQGQTSLVKNNSTDSRGCLKVLKRQRDQERRSRFRREAVALETLKHDGIPKLLSSNSEHYKEDTKLYMVSEFIEGTTLSESVEAQLLNFEDAIGMAISLANSLAYCHKRGSVHRDVKPDNIILRSNNPLSPVLVDFGLTYLDDKTSSIVTELGQHVGNRSLILPELLPGSTNRRNPISDLSQLANVFLYSLTGHNATILSNVEGLPHQRATIRNALIQNVPGDRLGEVLHFFDKCFILNPSDRWQSAPEFNQQLEHIKDMKICANRPVSDRLSAISEQMNAKPSLQLSAEHSRIARVAKQRIDRMVWNFMANTGISAGSSGPTTLSESDRQLKYMLYPEGENQNSKYPDVFILLKIIANEVVVTGYSDDPESGELIGRVADATNNPDYGTLEENLKLLFVGTIERLFLPIVDNGH